MRRWIGLIEKIEEFARAEGCSATRIMREISGTREYSGGADNPVILGWARFIGEKYPEMRSYCAQYNHDAIAWCGLTVAYCMLTPLFK